MRFREELEKKTDKGKRCWIVARK